MGYIWYCSYIHLNGAGVQHQIQPMGRHGVVYGRKVLLYYPEQLLYYPQTTVQGAVQQVPCLIIMGFDGAFQITALMAYAINFCWGRGLTYGP